VWWVGSEGTVDDGSVSWHESVLVEEVLSFLGPAPGKLFVDATVGTGGHSEALLSRGAHVIGVDQDPEALGIGRERLRAYGDRVRLIHGNFRDLPALLAPLSLPQVDGILFDLGVSSLQFDQPERGFSFQAQGPLDMRMDPGSPTTAHDLVNRLSEAELARVLWDYGEERHARRIARAIERARPIHTTSELARIVARASDAPSRRYRIHPATRTFQALRIAVNDELSALVAGLPAALALLSLGGVLCVISFHSLEDRIAKQFLRRVGLAGQVEVLTKKPLGPGDDEIARNPRARSAKLRAGRVREVAPDWATCP